MRSLELRPGGVTLPLMPHRRRAAPAVTAPQIALYGALLALGALGLDWIQYQRLARSRTADLYLLLVAAAFLAIGIWMGSRLLARRQPERGTGNPAAQASLGISDRELAVLEALSEGRSNNEMAGGLHISPRAAHSYLARVYEKRGAWRRIDALARASATGIRC